jgi:hypothetical protein
VVKFLSGSQFTGDAVPLCTFWRNDLKTDPDKELSEIESTGSTFANADEGQNSSIGNFNGQCIANAFFPKSTITCFNDGDCNGEGKCLPCSRYRSGGMKMAISHSPPTEALKFFAKGLTDDEIKSPNLVRFPASAAQATTQGQLPYHILLRNIQAEIAKCCRWNADTGVPGAFFLAQIKTGPDTISVVNAQGENVTIKGITVKNDAFPDEVGTFFPAGTVVVAGWEDQPSFFLEPRTGLIKPGDGVIYNFTTGEGVTETSSSIKAKTLASNSNTIVTSAVQAAGFACNTAASEASRQASFFNSAFNTNDPATIAAANAKLTAFNALATSSCEAANETPTVGQECITLIAAVIEATDSATLKTKGEALTVKLTELADLVETAGAGTTGTAAAQATKQVRLLRIQARQLAFSATGGSTRCEFFFDDNNIAQAWNAPTDGSLPCNGVRTDCQFYTGKKWKFATDEKMEHGRPILAEQIQEIRYRSENWSRFSDPEEEFKNRFSTPFVWAFKDYVDVSGEPDPSDPNQMLLFRPKVIFGRETAFSNYQQIRMTKVAIEDLSADEFDVSRSTSRTQPGSEGLNEDNVAPPFPNTIAQPVVPTATRLEITHPANNDASPFIYRMWTPDKNKITLFGTASPDQTIYIINRTALENRTRYLLKFGERNFFDVPNDLPFLPDFVGLTATKLLEITDELSNEKATNSDTTAPLGYTEVVSGLDGFWQSIQEIDLVHNKVNEIYAFLIQNETSIITDKTKIDCRFLHSIVSQDSFTGIDFSIGNLGANSNRLGTNSEDTAQQGEITATPRQLMGEEQEPVAFESGYYAWRFIDRGLIFGTLNADNDLQGQNPIADRASTFLVTEAAPSEFIVNVGYHVVEFEVKEQTVVGTDWRTIGDCGTIMLSLPDPNVNRVLPLPNQQGAQTPLTGILRNGGTTGSEIAQWGLTEVTLRTVDAAGASVTKNLVQFYRDPDGFGLPANYVVLGPGPDAEDQFGRPDPESDTITVSYKYIRGQSTAQEGSTTEGLGNQRPPVTPPGSISATAINTNFHKDNLRAHKHSISFDAGGGTNSDATVFNFGGNELNTRISDDQQDYVFVFKDSEGRPIGKKYMRFYVLYYNLACINVEIFYRWAASCTTYALIPDLFLRIGDGGGTTTAGPDATDDPADDRLSLGFRIANLLGDRDCVHQPNCGDHEFIKFGPLRREFEVIVNIDQGEGQPPIQKANFPSAGGPIEGEIVTSDRPGTQFLRRHGPMWYPYNTCERPRYQFNTNGPLKTDSTELINTTTRNPGLASAASSTGFVVSAGVAGASGGVGSGAFGGLPDRSCEAYQGPNQVVPKILDMHPSLRPCTSAYTYGNQVTKAGENRFAGYARKRGLIDTFLYEGSQWQAPPFGNFGRPRIMFELSSERGDFLGGPNGKQIGRRWMPMFPTRPNISASSGQFAEDTLEHAAYRMLCISTPVGSIAEVVSEGSSSGGLTILGAPRFTHKQIIGNKTGAAIEFPFSPYFPMFLPDGTESAGGNVSTPEGGVLGNISTMWAWREAEKPIQRGTVGPSILKGVQLAAPDYFIDNRRLEVELRPPEGNATLVWKAPKYKLDDGTLEENASLKLADGPEREIVIDFVNQKFEVADQEDTIYDLTAEPPCEATASDNPNMRPTCVCISDITDASLGSASNTLPSRFLHLDEIAPAGFLGLYSQSDLKTPFLVDIPRTSNERPCCMCTNYIPGLFFSLNGDYIPSVTNINPANDNRLEAQYTWSRVPHGLGSGQGDDRVFNSFEQLADTLVKMTAGEVFVNNIRSNQGRLDPINDSGAIFPSQTEAANRFAADDAIDVSGWLDPDDDEDKVKLKGGLPATDGISRGEPDPITLTMLFNTYVRITEVTVTFYAGIGFEAPKYTLLVVPPAARTNDLITLNAGVVINESLESAFESQIPDPLDNLEPEDVADGRAKFVSRLVPNYSRSTFWNTYGMEWQLKFPSRGIAQSMGIASIQMKVDALTDGSENTEIIGIRARKYYKSSGTPTSDNNPERFLAEQDSASVYWRTTEGGSFKGDNRHRAYAWGNQLQDNQLPIQGSDIAVLENLQREEYDLARSLLESPYEFNFKSFLPLDEAKWTELLGTGSPDWTTKMKATVNEIDKVLTQSNQTPLYGVLPTRTTFNAPGHVWVHNFEETYAPCCFGCVHSMLVNYDFLHLHDNLAVVETAGFWSELPSGFTRLIRSTIMLPDPSFQGAEGGVGSTVLLNQDDFVDAQGNPIPTNVLNEAGFTQGEDGQYYVDGSEPNVGLGGPSGPSPNCG